MQTMMARMLASGGIVSTGGAHASACIRARACARFRIHTHTCARRAFHHQYFRAALLTRATAVASSSSQMEMEMEPTFKVSSLPLFAAVYVPVRGFAKKKKKGKKNGKKSGNKKDKSSLGNDAAVGEVVLEEESDIAIGDDFDFDRDVTGRMNRNIAFLETSFTGIRAGGAEVTMLDGVMVDAYGAQQPMNAVAQAVVKGPQLLQINVFDGDLVDSVKNAIVNADLGFNPQADHSQNVVKVPVPKTTAEKRSALAKTAGQLGETIKKRLRNARKAGMDAAKKLEETEGEDAVHRMQKEVEAATETAVGKVTELVSKKQKELEGK